MQQPPSLIEEVYEFIFWNEAIDFKFISQNKWKTYTLIKLTIPFTNKCCCFLVSNNMLTFLCERYRTYVIIPYALISFQQSHSKWWNNICSGTLFSSQKIIWFLSEIFVILPVLKEKTQARKSVIYAVLVSFFFFYICILFLWYCTNKY